MQIVQFSGLTEEEQHVANLLTDAYNAFSELDNHDDETEAFTDSIARCQRILGIKVVSRLYPRYWGGQPEED